MCSDTSVSGIGPTFFRSATIEGVLKISHFRHPQNQGKITYITVSPIFPAKETLFHNVPRKSSSRDVVWCVSFGRGDKFPTI